MKIRKLDHRVYKSENWPTGFMKILKLGYEVPKNHKTGRLGLYIYQKTGLRGLWKSENWSTKFMKNRKLVYKVHENQKTGLQGS